MHWLILSLAGVSVISDWIERRAVHQDTGYILPDFRWVQWGTYRDQMFLIFKIPSYVWQCDVIRDTMCWHQRRLAWRADKGWSILYWPVREVEKLH